MMSKILQKSFQEHN